MAFCVPAPPIPLLAVTRLREHPEEETIKIFRVMNKRGVFDGDGDTSLVWISMK